MEKNKPLGIYLFRHVLDVQSLLEVVSEHCAILLEAGRVGAASAILYTLADVAEPHRWDTFIEVDSLQVLEVAHIQDCPVAPGLRDA